MTRRRILQRTAGLAASAFPTVVPASALGLGAPPQEVASQVRSLNKNRLTITCGTFSIA